MNINERFDKKWVHEPNTGCHIWTAGMTVGGYAEFRVDGKGMKGHRFAYEAARGPIPAGLYLDHICRVRACVNANHLRAVTPRQNVLFNSLSIQAANFRKTHCKRGHEFTPENTMKRGLRRRGCRVCHRADTKTANRKLYYLRSRSGLCVLCGAMAATNYKLCAKHRAQRATG